MELGWILGNFVGKIILILFGVFLLWQFFKVGKEMLFNKIREYIDDKWNKRF